MTSRNLYFKLMREDLKSRLWAVTLISLGFFFTFPVAAAFQAGEIENASNQATALLDYTNLMARALSFDNALTAFLMMMLAMICGMSSFAYLNSRSKVDFYHSIPIRRELLYAVNFIDGILIAAVPYAISVFLAVAVGIANHADGTRLWPMVLVACGLHLVYFILMYTVVIIAAMMTGNLGVGILGSMVFAFYIPLASTGGCTGAGLFRNLFQNLCMAIRRGTCHARHENIAGCGICVPDGRIRSGKHPAGGADRFGDSGDSGADRAAFVPQTSF
ncbi:MAG: hypothetical protein PHV18_06820 [Lachnospiraceae bacterium]|nr:hypothetical protein [Lachnospiraceae bacterium]